jgi:hypothetical protein
MQVLVVILSGALQVAQQEGGISFLWCGCCARRD